MAPTRFWTAIYLYRVDSRPFRGLLVGHKLSPILQRSTRLRRFQDSFSISVAGGGLALPALMSARVM